MTTEQIRNQLQNYEPRTFVFDAKKELRPASVIVLWNPATDNIVFTVRAGHLRKHAGQISFPGGRLEAGEKADDGAVREAQEEIGSLREDIEILGEIDRYQSVSSYLVQCFVAAWSPSAPMEINTEEIETVFEAPLSFFLEPANCRKELWSRVGLKREMFLWHWKGFVIWGLTARFLASLVFALTGKDLAYIVPLSESTQSQFESLPTYFTDAE